MNLLILFTVAAVFLTLPSDAKEGDTPRAEFILIEGKNYYVSFDSPNLNQNDAATFCAGLDMELLDMATPEKQLEVDTGIRSHGYYRRQYWTSGLRGADGRWIWTNMDQEFVYANWITGSEPGPGNDGVYFDGFRYGLGGVPPNVTNNFVCQELTI